MQPYIFATCFTCPDQSNGLVKILLDLEDSTHYSRWRWYVNSNGFVTRRRKRAELEARPGTAFVYLHRQIVGTIPAGNCVVFRNGNHLDMRRINLATVDYASPQWSARLRTDNTSGFRGVSFHKGAGRWQAKFSSRGVQIYLGLHDTPEEAAAAYEKKLQEVLAEYDLPETELEV